MWAHVAFELFPDSRRLGVLIPALQARNNALIDAFISLAPPLQVIGKTHRLTIRAIEEKMLLRQVMVLTFGTRWRVEMARFMDRLQ